ncbi:MAG: SRPBCC family protein [Cyclobacteriaceae bacterium]
MKWKMITLLLSIVAIIALAYFIGLMLPKEQVFVKEAILNSPTHEVFRLVTDVDSQTNWRADVKEVKVIDDQTWTEVPQKGSPITFRTKQKIENQLFEIEIIEPKSFNGYWVGTFESIDNQKTRVIFKEVIRIENPFFRLLSHIFVDLDKTMEDYMTNLKNQLDK